MRIRTNKKGVTSEVFKLALAVIVIAAILGLLSVLLLEVRTSTQASMNTTTGALEEFSEKIANRTASF